MKGKYTKNPLKEYNNRKANIHLTRASITCIEEKMNER
jgi:hypothetical protein